MTFEQIISNIRNKVYHPIYFLMGEEPYFIDTISDMIEEEVLDAATKDFNQVILYGNEVDVKTIVNQARNFPMMGNYLVVIVKEAQDVKNIESLDAFVEMIPASTILVLNYKYKKLDKRKQLAKLIDKKGVLFESKKLYDNNIPEWIQNFLAQKSYRISPKACQMMADFLGNELHKIRNELEKLMIALPPSKKIEDEDVERHIGISKDFNIFELQKAIGQKDVLKANQIINYFGSNSKDHPLIMTVIVLYGYFTKLLKLHYSKDKTQNGLASVLGVSPFFVRDYQQAATNYSIAHCVKCISVLREFDLKAKGLGSTDIGDSELYKELLFKVLH